MSDETFAWKHLSGRHLVHDRDHTDHAQHGLRWDEAPAYPAQKQRETLLPHCFPDSKVRSALGLGVPVATSGLEPVWFRCGATLHGSVWDYVTKSSWNLPYRSGTWALHSSLDCLTLWPCQKCLVWFRLAVTKKTGQRLIMQWYNHYSYTFRVSIIHEYREFRGVCDRMEDLHGREC